MDLDSIALHLCGRFENRACLHFGNLRKGDSQTAAAVAEHRIELVQLVHTPGNLIHRYAEFVCQLQLLILIVWQKLV